MSFFQNRSRRLFSGPVPAQVLHIRMKQTCDGCLSDRVRCVSIFLFLSASEILTVDFFPKFRYAVLAFEFFCSQLLNLKQKTEVVKPFLAFTSVFLFGGCATAPFFVAAFTFVEVLPQARLPTSDTILCKIQVRFFVHLPFYQVSLL